LTEAQKAAKAWQSRYTDELIQRSLSDSATAADAFNPLQIVNLLKPQTELKEVEGELVPMVRFQDIDEKTKEPIETLRTPKEAVTRMQELPQLFGNLFKPNVVGGVGAGTGTAGKAIDFSNMTPEEYQKLRRENPSALGM